jgi:hypothetical protein
MNLLVIELQMNHYVTVVGTIRTINVTRETGTGALNIKIPLDIWNVIEV